jgi:hypothetical protein
MSDFEDIQRLLRLKRYEKPSEDFVEDFVHQFQQRQRQELLRHSARGLLWERVTTYFEGLFEPKWRWAGAMGVALFAGFMVFRPGAAPHHVMASSTRNGSRYPGPSVIVAKIAAPEMWQTGMAAGERLDF